VTTGTPKESMQMVNIRTERDKNREDYALLLEKARSLEVFVTNTEEGKKKKAEQLKIIESEMSLLDEAYRELSARLEIETIDFIMNPNGATASEKN
jgi:DNA-binding protein H-NS